MFQRAERKRAKLRMALCGPAGSGKTYSSLLIAQGLVGDGKIAMIDSEHRSGELYADMLDYDVASIDPPYTPEKYMAMIDGAIHAGYDALIIDSLSHAWMGEGGFLEIHDRETMASRSKNSFDAWRKVNPGYRKFMNKILKSDIHIIATMRTKTAYEIVENDKGKKQPIKVGLAPIQRAEFDYEFTVVLDIGVDGHIATSSKDRTGLFDGQSFIPSADTGKQLLTWLNTGVDYATRQEVETVKALALKKGMNLSEVVPLLKEYGAKSWSTIPKTEVINIIGFLSAEPDPRKPDFIPSDNAALEEGSREDIH